jgi:hypothetical protein
LSESDCDGVKVQVLPQCDLSASEADVEHGQVTLDVAFSDTDSDDELLFDGRPTESNAAYTGEDSYDSALHSSESGPVQRKRRIDGHSVDNGAKRKRMCCNGRHSTQPPASVPVSALASVPSPSGLRGRCSAE